MKKMLYAIITLFICLIPFKIKAQQGITDYYIDVTVLNNGDINIKEIFAMNGSFNGMNRIINYGGNYIPFDGSINSFKGSDIYNGDSIIINSIKGISYNSKLEYSDLKKDGDIFTEMVYANKGDYGVYTKTDNNEGTGLLIYNPNKYNKAFYLDYTITNMAIVHNDIAELGLNIFTDLNEYVDNLVIYIHIPNNKDLIRVWSHGPLWGENEIIDNNTVKATIRELYANTPIDVRLAFDKEAISASTKYSNVDALDKIVEIETKLAEDANQKREEIKQELKTKKIVSLIFDIIRVVWLIGLGIIFFKVYKKYDKEYTSSFKTKYFRDFPSDNTPTDVGYLIRQKITDKDLSASILMLIYKKVLTFERIDSKKEDYILKYNLVDNLNDSDKKLIEFLFNKDYEKINNQESIVLSILKNRASNHYQSFLKKYMAWKIMVSNEALSKKFFETNTKVKSLTIMYSILGFIISYVGANKSSAMFGNAIGPILFITSIISFIYFITFTKRTVKGNEEYVKWIGLKKFMEDFGTMDKKELPEIVLWEKYLVYAVSLGCADKLAKTMKIRAEEFKEVTNRDILFDYYRFNTITNFNHFVSDTVSTAVMNANQSRNTANSSSSSGGGYGGGFSGGGGSFGGGGGGGRF